MARSSNTNKVWLIDRFFGGLSDGSKRGYSGAFRSGTGLDFRTDPDVLTGLRQFQKISGATITDVPKWMVTQGENLWVYGDTGKVYKRDSAGTWTNPKTISDSHGNGMAVFDDYLYCASDSGLHRYGPLSGTAAWEDDFLVGGQETSASNYAFGNTYALGTSVNEGATHKITWTATAESIKSIVLFWSPGVTTGDFTVVVHDASNAEVGREIVVAADLPGINGWELEFSNPVALTVGDTYHLHVYSSVADGSLLTGTANDLSTAFYAIYDNIAVDDIDVSDEVDATAGGITSASKAYTIGTSLLENSKNKVEFIPDKNNITAVSIQLYITPADTYTVKVHDADDVEVGTGSIVIAAGGGMGFRRIDLDSTISVTPGATYHLHLTRASGTGTASALSDTNGDFSGVGYRIHYQILNTDTAWHPMKFFPSASALAIGNGNHLALYDGITYRTTGQGDGSERLTFAKEEKVRCIELVADYLAIGVWKGDGIDDHGESRLYLWDGTSSFINAFKDVSGEINAIKTDADGLLNVWHGGFGNLSIYDGSLTLVKSVPNIGENKYIEVYPGAVTTWNGIVRFGISGGDSTTAKRGVYSYGRINKDYPRSLNFDAPISTGNSGSTVQVTSMLGIGPAKFFVGWKDDTAHGVDLINTSADQTTVTFESLIFDDNVPHFEKKSRSVKLTFAALANGQSIKVYTKEDRAADWTLLGTASYADDGAAIMKSFAFDARWRELELKIELITTGTSSPSLISVSTFFEIITDEQE